MVGYLSGFTVTKSLLASSSESTKYEIQIFATLILADLGMMIDELLTVSFAM